MKKILVLLSLLYMSFVCCSSSRERIHKDIESVLNKRIMIPYGQLVRCGQHVVLPEDSIPHRTMLIYEDSTRCSSCELKNLFYWKSLQDSIKEYDNNFQIVLIFSPRKNEYQKVISSLNNSDLSIPVYVDTCSFFLLCNTHIPDSPIMHAFVLNEENRIALVGNPLRNKNIEALLFKYVKEHRY